MTSFKEDWDTLPDWIKAIPEDQWFRMCVDLARYDLQFYSEWCWEDIAGQLHNAPMHDEWYRMLDPKPKFIIKAKPPKE